MENENVLKLVIAGPPKSGKSDIADILAGSSKGYRQKSYQPTVGVRILEFTAQLEVNGLQTTSAVQIWDSAGGDKWQQTWPAIAKGVDGVILVYNGHDSSAASSLTTYCQAFTTDLEDGQILVIAHKMGDSEQQLSRPKLSRSLEKVAVIQADIRNGFDDIKDAIKTLLSTAANIKAQKREAGEKLMLGDVMKTALKKPSPKAKPKQNE